MEEPKQVIQLVDMDENDYLFFKGSYEELKKLVPSWDGRLSMGDIVEINGVDKRIVQTKLEREDKDSDQVLTFYFQDKAKSIYR